MHKCIYVYMCICIYIFHFASFDCKCEWWFVIPQLDCTAFNFSPTVELRLQWLYQCLLQVWIAIAMSDVLFPTHFTKPGTSIICTFEFICRWCNWQIHDCWRISCPNDQGSTWTLSVKIMYSSQRQSLSASTLQHWTSLDFQLTCVHVYKNMYIYIYIYIHVYAESVWV